METSWFLLCNTFKQLWLGDYEEAKDAWAWFTFHTGQLLKGNARRVMVTNFYERKMNIGGQQILITNSEHNPGKIDLSVSDYLESSTIHLTKNRVEELILYLEGARDYLEQKAAN
jgi:hypothetical protein